MSQYCKMCNAVTNCTDNCDTCKATEDIYKMTLEIYPLADCGEDLCKGEPLEVSYEGTDLYILKRAVGWTIVNTMKVHNANDGLTLVESTIEKNGEYFDSDTEYFRVDLANGIAKFLID